MIDPEIGRRTVVKGAAWSVPVVAASLAAPSAAASLSSNCPTDWTAVAARAADATYVEEPDGSKTVEQVVMSLGVWGSNPADPYSGGLAGYHIVANGTNAPSTYLLTEYSLGFVWPFRIDWNTATLPSNFTLTETAKGNGSYEYQLKLNTEVTRAVVSGTLPLGDPAAAIPGFVLWGEPVDPQSYEALTQAYLTVNAYHITYFPGYDAAPDACTVEDGPQYSSWGLNPVVGAWSGTTGSWMDEHQVRVDHRSSTD